MIWPDRMFLGEWLRDPRLRALGRHLQWLLLFLRHFSDRSGRFDYSPADVHRAFYVSVEDNVSLRDVEEWMEKLRSLGFIKSYTGSRGRRVGEISRDYWRQKLSFGKSVFEAEGGEPELDLTVDPPPAKRGGRSDMKRDDIGTAASAAGDAAGAAPEGVFSGSAGSLPIPRNFTERLFLTMCALEGTDPAKLTGPGERKIKAALGAIKKVHPMLHPDDLEKAAAVYRRLFPVASVTAHALSVHWGKLAATTAPKAEAIVEPEPLGWRDWINENTPDAKYARGGEEEGTPWHDLPAVYRRYLIGELAKKNRRDAA